MVYTHLNWLFWDITVMTLPGVSDANTINKHCQALSHTSSGAIYRQPCKRYYSYFADEKNEVGEAV